MQARRSGDLSFLETIAVTRFAEKRDIITNGILLAIRGKIGYAFENAGEEPDV